MDLPDIGVSGTISLIIAVSALIGFIKGLIRTVLAMICLSLAGFAAFGSNAYATDLTNSWFESPNPWISKVIALIAGLVVYFISRYLLKFLINPFDNSEKCKRVGFGIPAALICLFIGVSILWAAMSGIRYAGSLTEIKQARTLSINLEKNEGIIKNTPLLIQAKQALDGCTLGKWHQKTDPFHTPAMSNLCQLLVMYQNTNSRVEMLKNSEIHQVLNQPNFIYLALDEKIQELIKSDDLRSLYHHTALLKALEDNQFSSDILSLTDPIFISLSESISQL